MEGQEFFTDLRVKLSSSCRFPIPARARTIFVDQSDKTFLVMDEIDKGSHFRKLFHALTRRSINDFDALSKRKG